MLTMTDYHWFQFCEEQPNLAVEFLKDFAEGYSGALVADLIDAATGLEQRNKREMALVIRAATASFIVHPIELIEESLEQLEAATVEVPAGLGIARKYRQKLESIVRNDVREWMNSNGKRMRV